MKLKIIDFINQNIKKYLDDNFEHDGSYVYFDENYDASGENETDVDKTEIYEIIDKYKSCNDDINSLLLMAIADNNLEIIVKLLSHPDVDINYVNKYMDYTPLMYAAVENKCDVLLLLLTYDNIDLNFCGAAKETAFSYALENKCYEFMEILVSDERFIISSTPADKYLNPFLLSVYAYDMHAINILCKREIPEYQIIRATKWSIRNNFIDCVILLKNSYPKLFRYCYQN